MITRNKCIAIAIVILGLLGLTSFSACSSPDTEPEIRAAIIDQLCLHPNEDFIEQTTHLLEDFGLEVNVYTGDNITVDFYRNLPAMGHKLVILRVHSGLLQGNPEHDGMTWLYTNEPYSKSAYTLEQLADRVSMAQTSREAPRFFAISSNFVTHSMKGSFDGAVVIMMGCDSMHFPDLALSLIDRGASTCIGWHRSVGLDYSEDAISLLLEKLVTEDMCIVEAMLETMHEKGPDPDLGAILKYYPEQNGRKTIAELIQ